MKPRKDVITQMILASVMSLCSLVGCSIADMDKNFAPTELTWGSKGKSIDDVRSALDRCSTKEDPLYKNSTMAERLDARSICMLKKGFQFIPKPTGYQSWCSGLENSIACRSVRGEYNIKTDD